MKSKMADAAVFMLLVIHTLDMELTRHYIGNDWARETFPPMSLCIRAVGIHNSIWVSRLLVYVSVWLYLRLRRQAKAQEAAILASVLYWASMITWLDSRDIIW